MINIDYSGLEPGTLRTQSENHTPVPTNLFSYSLQSRPDRLVKEHFFLLAAKNVAVGRIRTEKKVLTKELSLIF